MKIKLKQEQQEYLKKLCDKHTLGLRHYYDIKKYLTALLNGWSIYINRAIGKTTYSKIITEFFEKYLTLAHTSFENLNK
jgi:hypothetical protein